MWELEEGVKIPPPFSSDQQEEGPRGSRACGAMLPSNSKTLPQTHQIPNSSALNWEKQSPDLISSLPLCFPPSISRLGPGVKAQGKLAQPEAPDVFVI